MTGLVWAIQVGRPVMGNIHLNTAASTGGSW